jgi:hypothetical protein
MALLDDPAKRDAIMENPRLFYRFSSGLRLLEYQVDHLNRRPTPWWCPTCGGERPMGSKRYLCLNHARAGFDQSVEALARDQGWYSDA